jgi:hypothetical protein
MPDNPLGRNYCPSTFPLLLLLKFARNFEPATLDSLLCTRNRELPTLNLQTLKLEPATLNPQPATRNLRPGPGDPVALVLAAMRTGPGDHVALVLAALLHWPCRPYRTGPGGPVALVLVAPLPPGRSNSCCMCACRNAFFVIFYVRSLL